MEVQWSGVGDWSMPFCSGWRPLPFLCCTDGGSPLMAKLRIGSRGSQLALWQSNHISALLRARGQEVEIEIIHTPGDKITEEALAAGRVDLAVHSLKDLPTELPPGFEIAAITERQDPRDAFCSQHYASFQELPQGARVGTSSLG